MWRARASVVLLVEGVAQAVRSSRLNNSPFAWNAHSPQFRKRGGHAARIIPACVILTGDRERPFSGRSRWPARAQRWRRVTPSGQGTINPMSGVFLHPWGVGYVVVVPGVSEATRDCHIHS